MVKAVAANHDEVAAGVSGATDGAAVPRRQAAGRPSRPTATTRATWLRRIAVGTAITFLAFEAWLGLTYATLDPFSPPEYLDVFGERYVPSSEAPWTLTRIHATYARPEWRIVEARIGQVPFPLPVRLPPDVTEAPTLIWLHAGPDRYLPYSLPRAAQESPTPQP